MTEFTHIAAQMLLGGLIGLIGVWFGSRATRDGYREGLAMGEAIYRGSQVRPPESLDMLTMAPNSLAWKVDDCPIPEGNIDGGTGGFIHGGTGP